MVNYEFPEIDAFNFFKSKILRKKILINKINLDWIINFRKRPKKNWKDKHKSGGGIMFNFEWMEFIVYVYLWFSLYIICFYCIILTYFIIKFIYYVLTDD